MPKTNASFQVQGDTLVMHTHYEGGASATENLGVWIPGDQEHMKRLLARAFIAGRKAKAHDIKCVLRDD